MAISQKIWVRDITQALFQDNQFISKGINDDQYVIGGKSVGLPQGGSASTIERNRSTIPATGAQREDSEESYDLDWFSSTPRIVTNAEQAEVTYQKRDSILMDDKAALLDSVSNWMAYHWAPSLAAQQVRTTGDARVAFVSGATGNRKKITLADLASIKRIMDNQNVPQEGRIALLPAEMYNDLLEIDQVKNRLYNSDSAAMVTGAVGMLYGFSIFLRATVVSYTNASTPVKRAPGAADLAAANAGAIFWHPNFVRRAMGAVNVYFNPSQADVYGDKMSFDARAGGRIKYTNQRGVVALIEAAAA